MTAEQKSLSDDGRISRESGLALIADAQRWEAAYDTACNLIAVYERFDDVIATLSDARRQDYQELQAMKDVFRGKR